MAHKHELLVSRQIANPLLRAAKRQQLGPFDPRIGVLMRLTHIDQAKCIATIELGFHFRGRKILICWHVVTLKSKALSPSWRQGLVFRSRQTCQVRAQMLLEQSTKLART